MAPNRITLKGAASLAEAQARSSIYGTLARGFTYPDEELLDLILGGDLPEMLWALGYAVGASPSTSLTEMGSWVALRGRQALLQELSVDYTRLFVTGTPRVIAPPYESVYTGRRLLMGEPVADLVAAYREAGLEISEGYTDLPDHLAAELEFMRYLSHQESLSLRGNGGEVPWRERQKRFLDDHLIQWAPTCLATVSAAGSTPFYRVLAEVAQEYLTFDYQQLANDNATTEDEIK